MAVIDVKIPAYRVKIADVATGAVVVDKTLTQGPSNDANSLVEHTYGAEWERVRVRHKSDDGLMRVVFRYLNGGSYVTQDLDVTPTKPVEVQKPNGARFRVEVLTVPETEWATAKAIEFPAPRVVITGDGAGWNIAFAPSQKPCVCTFAVDGASKPEALPSVPFPSNVAGTQAILRINKGEFGAQDDAIVRLGVRGAGLSVRVKLPAGTGTVTVEPSTFVRDGSPNAPMLTEQYVLGKFNENNALIRARVRYQ